MCNSLIIRNRRLPPSLDADQQEEAEEEHAYTLFDNISDIEKG
jgi:hypothetical protein